MDVEDHRLKLYWSRLGGWGECACRWKSSPGGRAQAQWAEHITDIILKQRAEELTNEGD